MRIVSLAPSVTEILFAIGAGNSIVANTAYCDYPESAKKIPKVGSFSYINDEKIKKFKPDLVVTSTVVQHEAGKRYKDFNHIHLDPRSLDDIYNNILLLGKATAHIQQSEKLVNNMKKDSFKFQISNFKFRPKVYIEEWFSPPMASGNWVPDIVRLAGGTYFPGIKKRKISRAITDEEIQKFNPEAIFVSYCGYKDKSDPRKILDRPGWQDIAAVKNKRVFVLNDDLLNRPGPRILEAAKKIQFFTSSFAILSS